MPPQAIVIIALIIVLIFAFCAWICCSESKPQQNSNPINVPQNIPEVSQTVKTTIVQINAFKPKPLEQLKKQYSELYFGSFKAGGGKSMFKITAIAFKGSKILLATTKNQMFLYNLQKWKKLPKQQSPPQKTFISLESNEASALCIGEKYYYVALTFDKTIIYYEVQAGFKEVCRFPRNILKSHASAIHVSKNQKYIITVGSDVDLSINIWSMKGEKLSSESTYFIKHFSACCGTNFILIRGGTSQIKIYGISEQKDGSFKKLVNKKSLDHAQSLFSTIDNRDMYALTISKLNKVKIWNLFDSTGQYKTFQSDENCFDIVKLKPKRSVIYTVEPMLGHFKTLVVLSNDEGFIITDTKLKTISKVEGVQIIDITISGKDKSIILATINNQHQISLWTLKKELEKIDQVNL